MRFLIIVGEYPSRLGGEEVRHDAAPHLVVARVPLAPTNHINNLRLPALAAVSICGQFVENLLRTHLSLKLDGLTLLGKASFINGFFEAEPTFIKSFADNHAINAALTHPSKTTDVSKRGDST